MNTGTLGVWTTGWPTARSLCGLAVTGFEAGDTTGWAQPLACTDGGLRDRDGGMNAS